MSLITGLQKSEIPDFMGANYRGESSDVRPPWLLRATNVQFEEGYVRTRRGVYIHSSKNVGNPVNGFYNMPIGSKSWVLTAEDDGTRAIIRSGEYNAAASGPLTTENGSVGATFASVGDRAYVATFDINYALGLLYILDDIDTSLVARQTWIPPLTTTYMAAWTFGMVNTASANYATPGTHNFALAFTSDTGFVTRASPNLSGNVSPYQTAVTTGNKLVITVTPDAGHKWPAYKSVQLLATPTRNLNKYYFVAGTEQTVPDATTTALVFEFAIQDSALVNGTPFDNYENVIYTGQFATNEAPLKPYYVFNCGERMGYFFQDSTLGYGIAISDPNDPEHITMDQHIIYLPRRTKPIAAKWTQSTIYLFTENGTFGYSDNGDVPVTWATPRTIDDKVGTQVPYGISLDSNGYGFVAHRTGLYAFNGGLYDAVPLSYYINEDSSGTMQSWDKIKWNYASAYPFVVVDDKENFRVIVKASNISGSDVVHTWNYVSGKSAKDVRYSNWTFNGGTVPGWVAIVQNNGDAISATRRQQLWLEFGSSNSPWLLERPSEIQTNKFIDTLDVGFDFLIDSDLYFPFLPERPIEAGENRQHYIRLRLRGSGTMSVTIKGIDELLSVGPLTQTLATNKARDFFYAYSMISESASARLTLTGAAGSWFELSNFVQYWKHFVAKQ